MLKDELVLLLPEGLDVLNLLEVVAILKDFCRTEF